MTVEAPTDPLSTALPPLVVARYRSADGRAEVALRSSVFLDGAWWSCLDRTFQAGAGFLVPHWHAHTDEVHFVRDGVVRYLQGGRRAYGASRRRHRVSGRHRARRPMGDEGRTRDHHLAAVAGRPRVDRIRSTCGAGDPARAAHPPWPATAAGGDEDRA